MDSEAQTVNQRREGSPGRGQELGYQLQGTEDDTKSLALSAACWVSTQVRNHNLLWRDGEHLFFSELCRNTSFLKFLFNSNK